MKMKKYMTPELEVIKLKHNQALLAQSEPETPGTEDHDSL